MVARGEYEWRLINGKTSEFDLLSVERVKEKNPALTN